MGRRVLLILALGGCSVEGARQVGDTCLSDRECVAPLRCELTPAGAQRCVIPARVDASVPPTDVVDVSPAPDLVDVPMVPPDGNLEDGGGRD